HNSHLGRKQAVNEFGEPRSHRTYRKRTKRWDVIPVLEKKSYSYIEPLICQLFCYRYNSEVPIRSKALPKPPSHPEMINQTTAHIPPPPTSNITERKISRFSLSQ
uniref:Uncharacterized protein n=1 Tax=Amphimedon queenslandica TaxID=400682 RepID=A0A1X7T558_AMPQE